ncbi:ATP-dependent helicase [Cohnella kolymensis]|uniref:ATP-dependent helicase n=1 Tax=Cohnella kolymensis TaxID=1590652 RepID=A0ABR5A864_9BACL|nr:ATP-dependent DNA helicase [Cohnella kolymensis]KIL36597.1 ATP-dependent helicase [Cohnella kolymensis]
MSETVALSVRSLVEHVFRSGSLDTGFRTAASLTEGSKAHQKIQKQYGEQDQKEVYLSSEIVHGDLLFVIDGRCDGLLQTEDGLLIDEIKSTVLDLEHITEDLYPVHWAQAKCYAYMYAKKNDISGMRIRLTYVQIDTEKQKRFEQKASLEELEHFMGDVIERYAPYARMIYRHRRKRNESIARLEFPFETYREGQRKLAGSVYKTIEEGRKLFARAPTGIGKTISTLFPSVKAIGQGTADSLFYLTAKTITRTAAEEAFAQMAGKGLHMHVVTVTAKDKICFHADTGLCGSGQCEFADGYYDRINGAMLDLLSNETRISRQVIEQYARKHKVCPFEFSLDAAYAADAVICDYNYIFDPRVSFKRLSAEHKGSTVLLVDEAHNLIDRAREMFSATLDKREFLELQREFKGRRSEIYAAVKAINDFFIKLRKQSEHQSLVLEDQPAELRELAEAFSGQAERELAINGAGQAIERLLDVYFAVQTFLRIAKLYDERYVTFVEVSRSDVRLKLFCRNPAHLLRQTGKGYRSHIYFSATLSPLRYYMDMLGADPDDYSVSIASPFSADQWEVSVMPISTRYRDRERSIAPLVRLLHRLLDERPGNYLFFFPSYEFMNNVYEAFAAEKGTVRTQLQTSEMKEDERESFLLAFDADNEQAFASFAVMGGIFSEGIDLIGNRLNGVVVVGVGMPQIGMERDLIKNYFDGEGKNGFDYAYVYPGINKVMQAGGRLIRSEQDRGILVLVDDRYLQPRYRRLMPEEWSGPKVILPDNH